MTERKKRSKSVRFAGVAVLFAIVGAAALLRVAGHRPASTPSGLHHSLLTSTTTGSAASLKGYNVFIQCRPNERDPLIGIASSRDAQIQPSLDVETDLVVLGMDADGSRYAEVRQEAGLLHIPVLDQAQLAKFRPPVMQ